MGRPRLSWTVELRFGCKEFSLPGAGGGGDAGVLFSLAGYRGEGWRADWRPPVILRMLG